MADDEKEIREDEKQEKSEQSDAKSSKAALLPWIIMAVIVVVCAGSGFGLGRLVAGWRLANAAESSQEKELNQAKKLSKDISADDEAKQDDQNTWYYDVKPIVANLNEVGATRFIRVTLTLEVSSELEKKEGEKFLETKNPVIADWLNVYLGSLSVEDCSGKNKKHIQSQILDGVNEKLFPNTKPLIKHILFREFNIQ